MKRKIIAFLLKIYVTPLNAVLKRVKLNYQKVFKSELFKQLYSENEYSMMSYFPKTIEDKKTKWSSMDFDDVAVVIQGPLISKDDFTINTIKMYKQYYNNIKIIISTWIDSDKDLVERIKKMDISIILNEYPQYHGFGNINYQITTSFAGTEKAKELGVKYVLKTRTDQRFYNPCALSLLKGVYQNGRIIMLGGIANSFYSRPFYISDFMAYGSIEELLLLYNCKFDTEENNKINNKSKEMIRFKKYISYVNQAEVNCTIEIPPEYNDSHIRYKCAEILLAYQYYCKKNDPERFLSAKEAYDDFLKNQVIIIDADSLGFYWLKYDHQVSRQTWFDRLGKLDEGKWHSILQEQKQEETN